MLPSQVREGNLKASIKHVLYTAEQFAASHTNTIVPWVSMYRNRCVKTSLVKAPVIVH